MTYDEATKMLKANDIYHTNEKGNKSKWKIVPGKAEDYGRYVNDTFSKGIIIDNENVKNYSSNSEFALASFICQFLPEENFKF